MNNTSTLLYYLAFIPPEPLLSRIESIKKALSETYQTYTALRSPAHITVQIPFSWDPAEEPQLLGTLGDWCVQKAPIPIQLQGFGAFPPRVVFIKPEPNEALHAFREDVLTYLQNRLHISNERYAQEAYTPHITLAHRDWTPDQFYEAWASLEKAPFQADFTAHTLSVLRHREGGWDVIKQISLGKL